MYTCIYSIHIIFGKGVLSGKRRRSNSETWVNDKAADTYYCSTIGICYDE